MVKIVVKAKELGEWSHLPPPDKIRYKELICPDSVGSKLLMGIAELDPGEKHMPHYHDQEEAFIIFDGEALITVDDETVNGEPGMAFYCPPGSQHSMSNSGKKKLLLCYAFPSKAKRFTSRVKRSTKF